MSAALLSVTLCGRCAVASTGDVNCDGTIDILDVASLTSAIFEAGGTAVTTEGCAGADTNGDAVVTAADVVAVLRLLPPPPVGPHIVFFGLAAADGTPISPDGEDGGTPIFQRVIGAGWRVVVEAAPGDNGVQVGTDVFNRSADDPTARPDLQIEASQALGDGNPDVCTADGGVPGFNPPDFGPTQQVANALNDFACGFAVATAAGRACTVDAFGVPAFASLSPPPGLVQFCLPIDSVNRFADGQTLLSAQVRDQGGNLGPLARAVVRVGTRPPATSSVTPTQSPQASSTPTPSPSPPPMITPSSPVPASPTRTVSATWTPTATGATPPPHSPTLTGTATMRPTPVASPTGTRTSVATRTAIATPVLTPTASGTPAPSPTATVTPTPPASETPTATVPPEPVVTFFGVARADNSLVAPDTTQGGIPVYSRVDGSGFFLVVEGRPGGTGAALGREVRNLEPGGLPDLQIEVSRDLGNGSPAVCDDAPGTAGGVPATDPVDFSVVRANAINDLACRFKIIAGQPDDACTRFADAVDHFVDPTTTLQFCSQVDQPFAFQGGDTVVTVRLRDVAGNVSADAQLIMHIGGS